MKRRSLKTVTGLFFMLALFMSFTSSASAASSRSSINSLRSFRYIHIADQTRQRVYIYSLQARMYVAEEDNQANHPLHARTPFPPGPWETFRFASGGDTNVCDGQTLAIYSVQAQLYVAEEDNQAGHPLNARTPLSSSGTLGPWEQFQVVCF